MSNRTAKHATVVSERVLKASPETVFAAWADPKIRVLWDVPDNNWVVAEQVQDFRIGGREASRFGPKEDPRYSSEGIFLEIAPNARIVSAGTMHDRDQRMTCTLCTIELYPAGQDTRLVLTDQSVFFGMETPKDREGGWAIILDRLDAHLRGRQ